LTFRNKAPTGTTISVNGEKWLVASQNVHGTAPRFVAAGSVSVVLTDSDDKGTLNLHCTVIESNTEGRVGHQLVSGEVGRRSSFRLDVGELVRCTVMAFGPVQAPSTQGKRAVNADVSIVKTGTNVTAAGAQTAANFVLAIANAGAYDAENVRLFDDVPEPLQLLSPISGVTTLSWTETSSEGEFCSPAQPCLTVVTCTSFQFGLPTNFVQCSFVGKLHVNQGFQLTIPFVVPSNYSGPPGITNFASVNSTTPDTDPNNNLSNHTIIVEKQANLHVTVSGPDTVTAGASRTYAYTLNVCNLGLSDAINVTANLTMATPSTFVINNVVAILPSTGQPPPIPNPALGTCTFDPATNLVQCFNFSTAASRCNLFRVEATVPASANGPSGGLVNLCGSATSGTPDVNPATGLQPFCGQSCCQLVNVTVVAALRIVKSGSFALIAGDPLGGVITLVVSNAGPSRGYGITLIDAVPAPFLINAATVVSSKGSCNVTNNVLNCNFGDVDPGNQAVNVQFNITTPSTTPATIQFPSQAPSANAVINRANISSVSPVTDINQYTSTHPIDVLNYATLNIIKLCPTQLIVSGTTGPYAFQIEVSNNGPSVARNVNITDLLPAGLTFAGVNVISGNAACGPQGSNVFCTVQPFLNVGQPAVVIQVLFTPPAGLTSNTSYTNTAIVRSSTSPLPGTSSVSTAQCTVTVVPPPFVGITKTGPSTIQIDTAAGQTFQYFIQVLNQGPYSASNVLFNDTIPPQFPVTGVTVSDPSNPSISFANNCNRVGQVINCDFGTLQLNEAVNIVVNFQLASGLGPQVVRNTAFTSAFLNRNPNPQASWDTTLLQGTQLIVEKTGTAVCAGSSGVFAINVRNAGQQPALNVVLSDPWPAGIQFVSTNQPAGVCVFANGNLTCSWASLAAQSNVLVLVTYSVPSSYTQANIVNSAYVSTTTFQASTAGNSVTATIPVNQCPALSLTKAGPATVTAGLGNYVYTLVLSSTGPSDAYNVVFSDPLPKTGDGQFWFSASSVSPAACSFNNTASGSSVSCSFATLPAGTSQTIQIVFSVPEGYPPSPQVTNCATASITSSTVQACNSTVVQNLVDVAITKAAQNVCPVAGSADQIQFTLRIWNNGPSRAYAVTVSDSILFPYTYVANSITVSGSTANGAPSGCSVVGATLSCSGGWNLSPLGLSGNSVVVTYNLSVPAQATPSQPTNVAQAFIGCTNGQNTCVDTNTTNNIATLQTQTCVSAPLSITKSCPNGGQAIEAGTSGPYFFTVNIANAGPSFAYGVTITDIVPAPFTVVGVSASTSSPGTTQLSCTQIGNNVTCSASSANGNAIPPGVTGQILIQVVPPGVNDLNTPVTVVNTATITATGPAQSFSAPCTIVVNPAPFLVIRKRGRIEPIIADNPSTIYNYVITITNQGPVATAQNVRFTDSVPGPFIVQTNLVTITGPGTYNYANNCGAQSSGNNFNCNFGSLDVGQTITITVPFTVPNIPEANITVQNCAFVFADRNRNPTNFDCWSIVVNNGVNLKVIKFTPDQVCAGTSANYTIEVTNFGPAIATDVVVRDSFPPQYQVGPNSVLSVVNIVSGQVFAPGTCSVNSNFMQCNLGSLAVNNVVRIIVQYFVPSSTPAGPVPNTVSVDSSTVELPNSTLVFTRTNNVILCTSITAVKTGTTVLVAGQSSNGVTPYGWTLTVTNNGPSDVQTVQVSDALPQGITVIPGTFNVSNGGTCFALNSNTAIQCSWPIGVSPLANVTVSFHVTVDPSSPQRTDQNCVNAQTTTPSLTASNCLPITILNVADVAITKTAPPQCIPAGTGDGLYVLVITNNGPSNAYSVLVSDNIPSPLQYVSNSLSTPLCRFNAVVPPSITCDFGTMTPLQSITVTYRLSAPANAQNQTQIPNTAIVTSGCVVPCTVNSNDPNTNNNVATAVTDICARASLAITKTTTPGDTFIAGDGLTHQFIITVSNAGPAFASNVVVTDFGFTGGQITGISASNGGTCLALPSLQCTFAQLADGASVTVTVLFTIPANQTCGPYPNFARATTTTYDPQGPVTAQTSINVIGVPRLTLTKTGNAQQVLGGVPGFFTLVVSNTGVSDAHNVVLSDPLPSPLFAQAIQVGNGCSIAANTVTCNFGTIPAGAQQQVQFTYTVQPDAPALNVTNVATVSNNDSPACETKSSAQATFVVQLVCVVDLAVTKTDNWNQPIIAGDGTVYTFVINVTNLATPLSPSAASNVDLQDVWPTQYTTDRNLYPIVQSNGNPGSVGCVWGATGFRCFWNSPIQPGAQWTIIVRYTVGADVAPGPVTNTVNVTSGCTDINLNNNHASDTNIVVNNVDLQINKDDHIQTLIAGGQGAIFTLTVYNAGPSSAINATVTDNLPSYYTLDNVVRGANPATSCVRSFNSVICTWDVFPAGQTSYVYLSYHVNADVLVQTGINCANVTNAINDTNTNNNGSCDVNTIQQIADLAIYKNISTTDCLMAGSPNSYVYTVTVFNNGPSYANQPYVIEQFPPGIQISSVPSGCFPQGNNVYRCNLAPSFAPPGTQWTLTFPFTVPAGVPAGIIWNVANVTSLTFDPELCNNNVSLASAVCNQADVSVTKTDGVSVVVAGDGIRYVYNITGVNHGPSTAVNVKIDDVWPNLPPGAGFRLEEIKGANCTRTALGFVCSIGDLAVGQSYSFCVYYTVDACAIDCIACNVVQISSDVFDPVPTNNVAEDCNNITSRADLNVTKTDGVTNVTAGDGLTYTYSMVVCNSGPSCAQKVSLVDHFPPQARQIANSIRLSGRGSCIVQGGTGPLAQDFSCDLLTLRPNECETVWVSFTVPAQTTTCSIHNTVIVSSITFDPELCNNVASDTDAVLEKARLSVTKTSTSTRILLPAGLNTNNTFFIAVTNNGPSTAREVTVTDTWPYSLCQYMERTTTTQGVVVTTGQDLTASLGDIAPGQTVTITIPYSVCQNAVPGTIVTNNVTAFSPTDTECREAYVSVLLDGITKREEVPVVFQPRSVTKVEERTDLATRSMPREKREAETVLSFNPRLSALTVDVKVEKTATVGQYSVRVHNPNKAAVRIIDVNADLLIDGALTRIDLTKTSATVKVTSCNHFAQSKLLGGWSEECIVQLRDGAVFEKTRVSVTGAAKMADGTHSVVGAVDI